LLGEKTTPVSSEEFADRFGADPADFEQISQFASAHGLTVESEHLASGSMVLAGTAAQVQRAFQVNLHSYESGENVYRIREGLIYIPDALREIVRGIFGLDNRPQARAHFRKLRPNQAAQVSYDPTTVAALYQFPPNLNGQGETVGIIELGGGYQDSDLQSYFSGLNLMLAPQVTSVSVDGAQNAPGADPNGADGEVELDIEVVGAIAPGAAIKVYFAPNTDQGFVDAITTAVHDSDVSIVSISWGQAESNYTAQSLALYSQAFQDAVTLGKTVLAAAGDSGSSDGVTDGGNHVDFPASSPYVLACGGTTLIASANDASIASETVWNESAQGEGATGGGVSEDFTKPSYQAGVNVPPPTTATGGRGVPDVAGDADPVTGYNVLIDGSRTVIGGTSAVAPLYAGLFARINQALRGAGKPAAGFAQPKLYQNPQAFNDITNGSNGAFQAGPGWDATTGLGSPNGTKMLQALS
jgi:kumamolisin